MPAAIFFESFNACKFSEAVEQDAVFVQDNQSHSKQLVLSGLHFQAIRSQCEVFYVAVDLRYNSPIFGQWVRKILSAENNKQPCKLKIFAHGFLVLSDAAQFQYKIAGYRYPEYERRNHFDDPEIGIAAPLSTANPALNWADALG